MFAPNIGETDRIARVTIGLVMIMLAATGPETPWGALGIYPLMTGLLAHCPAYKALDIDTREAG